ncbi:MAG: protein translocase subunit SecF [Candidatus Kapabacteria bacterium]|nr:protein translocase subunit SecF [Candidatus Kapabacteria bacterium]
MDLIKQTNIDFVTKRNVFFMTSLIATVVGLIIAFLPGMIELGIDFTGGTQISVAFENKSTSADQVRAAVSAIGFSGAEIKSFGKPGEYLIRINETGRTSEISANIISHLQKSFPKDNVVLLGADNVDPKVSNELAIDSLISLGLATLIILLYVAIRFQLAYGISSIVALAHDVLMAFVISVLFNKLGLLNLEISINSLAAYLTILGYSINDKVVVFDRIRENRDKHKGMALAELVNLSLNETLSRTLITGMSVLAALLVMVFMGGDVLEGFAFTMFIGIVIGTYSSIYIASSFLIWYTDRVKHKNVGTVSHQKA